MEEVVNSNKKLWIIAIVIVSLIVIAGIAIAVFSSSNKQEKSAGDMTIQETIDSCMQTCKQIPTGSTRTSCESGCSQTQKAVADKQAELVANGITENTTIEEMQEKLSVNTTALETQNTNLINCLNGCDSIGSEPDKADCMNFCVHNQ